jgi:hypothetical protein
MSYRNAGNAEWVRRAAGLAYHLASTHGRGAGAAFFTKTIGRRGEQVFAGSDPRMPPPAGARYRYVSSGLVTIACWWSNPASRWRCISA